MFNPDFKNKKVNYEIINASVIFITAISIISAAYQLFQTIFNIIIFIQYNSLDIYIMVSILVTALITFISFKGLADELDNIFIKLSNSIIEKDKKIKELEDKLVKNNINMSKLEHENMEISKLLDENIDNLIINLTIEDNSKTKK